MGSGLLSAAVRHQGTRMPGWSRGTQAGEGLPREEEGRGGKRCQQGRRAGKEHLGTGQAGSPLHIRLKSVIILW